MKKLTIAAVVLIVVAIASVVAIGKWGKRPAQHKPVLAVSILPQKTLLQDIVGNRYEVICLLGQESNPETFEPDMSHFINLERSEAFFKIGNLGFEMALDARLHQDGRHLRVVDSAAGIDLIAHSHGSSEIDPHVWSSVPNAIIIADNMLCAVLDIDPDHADYYRQRHAALDKRLHALDDTLRARLEPCRDCAFAIWHPSLSYFARDYGLRQISLSPDGKESTVTAMRNSLVTAARSHARIFFYQPELDPRQADAVRNQLNIPAMSINPMAADWENQLLSIADAIAKVNTCE